MTEAPVLISVVIVTWNADRFIKQCLDSVFAQDVPLPEVIVVDNGSSDTTIAILNDYAGRIILFRNDSNRGFCAANNQALLKASGRYVLTLNSDVVLEKNYIAELVTCLEHNPRVGMVQGKMLRMDGTTLDCCGLHLGWGIRFYNIGEGKPDDGVYDKEREIFGPCAAAALYRRELLEDIRWGNEFFDSRFFFLVDDFDLAWRARHKGWKALYVPQARCRHYRDSSGHRSAFRQYLSFRNRYFLIIKNGCLSAPALPAVFILLLCYDIPRAVVLLLSNPYAVKAVRELRDSLPEMWDKRKKGGVCRTR